MKVALMGGAYKNAGDFLIENRSRRLIEEILNADVTVLKRNIAYDSKIDELEQYDLIVFAGGPIFNANVYPGGMPFIDDFEKLKVPVRILGGGWKGKDISAKSLYETCPCQESVLKFSKYYAQQSALGCRDWYTIRMLKLYGITNTIMTGCPAWYDMEKIDKLELDKMYSETSIKDEVTIGISDAAFEENKKYFWDVINIINRYYSKAKIKVLFHRGISSADEEQIRDICKRNNRIEYFDISGSADGLKEYDDCFLHIGFRVHAHIYNLSQGRASILINEDARGAGVNQALGIENFNIEESNTSILRKRLIDGNIENKLLDYIDYIDKSNYYQYRRAMAGIRFTFDTMVEFIKEW